MSKYTTMTGPELVSAYMEMLESPEGKRLVASNTYRPVSRFADTTVGAKRCERLESSIVAVQKGDKNIDDNPEGTNEMTTKKKKEKKARVKKERTNGEIRKAVTERGGKLTNRQKLKNAFLENLNKPLSESELQKAVYGSTNEKYKVAFRTVVRSLEYHDIGRRGKEFPYTLTRIKNEDGTLSYKLNNA